MVITHVWNKSTHLLGNMNFSGVALILTLATIQQWCWIVVHETRLCREWCGDFLLEVIRCPAVRLRGPGVWTWLAPSVCSPWATATMQRPLEWTLPVTMATVGRRTSTLQTTFIKDNFMSSLVDFKKKTLLEEESVKKNDWNIFLKLHVLPSGWGTRDLQY